MLSYRKIAAVLAAAMLLGSCGTAENSSTQTADDASSGSEIKQTAAPAVTLPPKEDTPEDIENTDISDSSESIETDDNTETETDTDTETDTAENDYSPAVWKVTSPEGKEMYMAGSMHALKDECYPLPDYFQKIYDDCDVLAVECDISDFTTIVAAQLKFTDRMTYPAGDSIEAHLSSETWQGLCGYLEHYDSPPELYTSMQPWYLYSAIQSFSITDAGLDSGKGLDNQLLTAAHEENKEIYEVESVESQYEMLSGFSDEVYDMLLTEYNKDNITTLNDSLTNLYAAWRTGNVETVSDEDDVDTSGYTEDELSVYDDFMQQMYYDRNTHMAETAEELIAGDKSVFFVVGLAHYSGEKGIISLLEKDGYKAERIDP